MRTIITVLAATAATFTATAAFAAEGEQSFVYDGATYVYTTQEAASGQRVIDGKRSDGTRFHLVVANKRVSGTTAGVPVSFSVASARGAAAGAESTGGIEAATR